MTPSYGYIFSSHINQVWSKANNNTLKFIKRNIRTINKKLKEAACNIIIVPRSGTPGKKNSHSYKIEWRFMSFQHWLFQVI